MGTNPVTAPAASGPELLVELRPDAGRLRGQVEDGLRRAVRAGRLAPGARLPASRVLARDLGVSRRLVVEAYAQLAAEGYLEARTGAGTYVRGDATPPVPPPAERPIAPERAYDFFPGAPDLSAFPRAAWLRCLRAALAAAPDRALSYGDPRGQPELRAALAAYLRRARGVEADPDRIVVTAGAVQGLALLAGALGPARIAVEDPYLPEHRLVLAHAGAEVVPVPVDAEGLRTADLRAAGTAAALVTPAHQFPTGAVLSPRRRTELAEWAAAGGLVIEDDYDAEYRYDRTPLGAVQGLAPDRVAYLGSASKILAPALRIGWLVLPAWLLQPVAEAKRLADAGSPALDQLALARFIAEGRLDRHLRAARRAYRARRHALAAALAVHLPEARMEGAAAGLHAVVRLPRAVPARPLLRAAARESVGAYPLGWAYAEPRPDTDALIVGYAGMAEASIPEGVRRLAAAVRAAADG